MTFLISFSKVFGRMMGLNILGKSYDTLLDFGMMIEDDSLKWVSQWPSVIHTLVMLMKLLKHFLFFMTAFRCFYKMWSSLEVDKLLHLSIALLNFSWEKGMQIIVVFEEISFKMPELIQQSWAELNVWCKAY